MITGAFQSRPDPSRGHQLAVDQREELGVAAVHVVGHSRPMAFAREGHQSFHAVAVGLHHHAFPAVLHGSESSAAGPGLRLPGVGLLAWN